MATSVRFYELIVFLCRSNAPSAPVLKKKICVFLGGFGGKSQQLQFWKRQLKPQFTCMDVWIKRAFKSGFNPKVVHDLGG